jgi:hypothetical protein
MMRLFRPFVVGPLAILTVGLSPACGSSEPRKVAERPPALVDTPSVPQTTPVLGDSIEGVYSNAHTVRSVDGLDKTVEDVIEIVVYDPTHVFFRIVTRFDMGHSCRVLGIATLEHGAFVYRSRQLPLSHTRPCTLRSKPPRMNFASAIGSNHMAPRRVASSAGCEVICPMSPSAECTDGRFKIRRL